MKFHEKVDNEKLYELFVKYNQKKRKDPHTQVPEYIKYSFYIMANKLSYRRNFINYPYKDDMINSAFEICLRYVDTFNPNKTRNPYSYYCSAITNSFIQYIKREKKELKLKKKMIEIELERVKGYGRKRCTSEIKNDSICY